MALDAYAFAWDANQSPRVRCDLRSIRKWISEVGQRGMYFTRNREGSQAPEPYEDSDGEGKATTVNVNSAGRFAVVESPCTLHL